MYATQNKELTTKIKEQKKVINEYEANKIKEYQKIGKYEESQEDIKGFLSKLELGEWLVIVGSYKNRNLAQEEVERIK